MLNPKLTASWEKGLDMVAKKDIKAEEKYQAERLEIVDLLRQKEIEVQDIMIKKDNRFIVEIYLTRLLENTKLEQTITEYNASRRRY